MQNENVGDVSSSMNEESEANQEEGESVHDRSSGVDGADSQASSHDTSGTQAPDGEPDDESTLWAMFAHLSAFSGIIIPFGNILGPLIIWLVKKKEDQFVDYHGKESLNFQISMTIYSIVAALTLFIIIGFILLPIIVIANIVLTIIAAIQARDGDEYEYPFTLRLVS